MTTFHTPHLAETYGSFPRGGATGLHPDPEWALVTLLVHGGDAEVGHPCSRQCARERPMRSWEARELATWRMRQPGGAWARGRLRIRAACR